MENAALLDLAVVHRHQLVETLEQLDHVGWDTPSLCARWRVREVVGHLLATLETPFWKLMVNLARYRGFDRYADHAAKSMATASPSELLRRYRAAADSRFAPPGIGPIAPLTDVMVHTRDVERPLDRRSRLDPTALAEVLGWTAGGRARSLVPPGRIAGLRFVATDLDRSFGDGAEVSGPGEAILLALTDRAVALDDLDGHGVPTLRARLT